MAHQECGERTGCGGASGRGRPREGRDVGALRREVAALRAENLALRQRCHALAGERRGAAAREAQLEEILGSRAWALVVRARRIAASILGDDTARARALSAATRRLRQSAAPVDPSDRPIGGRGVPIPEPPLGDGRPSVSVIVPNYNHAPYLEERLRSIFRQTRRPREILFLDDASTDESVAIARRLAAESPVPFRVVVNEANGGSPFRQWLRGIDLARGDLVWIAESDDTCRPELLARLVPLFDDPGVMLAYCRSSMIGPDGARYDETYLEATEDLSPVWWRHPYCVPGREEVERALGRRNTIPNASAVVFRRPDRIEERRELESMRLGGDWLFYAMRIRRGKIAYVPEPLNGHRHHDRTVRHAFERAIELFEEQLRVKAMLFESFPVSPTAMSASLAGGFAEYADRMQGLDARAMTDHPRLSPHLDRIRDAYRARVGSAGGAGTLVVLSGATDRSTIRRINAMARRGPVFLCNALPDVLDPATAARVDERVVLIEGTLGLSPWSVDDGRHASVIRELIRFHRIGAIRAEGPRAAEFAEGWTLSIDAGR